MAAASEQQRMTGEAARDILTFHPGRPYATSTALCRRSRRAIPSASRRSGLQAWRCRSACARNGMVPRAGRRMTHMYMY
ncbi:hypothetical protein Bcep1808_4197 [Burkholderia vietnamiensis G4]|uniref:Uncharacterized protein n=1 Tax=Burkholderia vietnamiensis (strain G4 / LMG 22486) TaxID=269482 RepID=A4JLM4_BURVG|nr:hypothetical protein Bcep1808_4197 [Burkholderia vietnamiensis G4]